MYTDKFKAGVRYNDWTGTSAYDDADQDRLCDWIEKKKLKNDNEFLVGVEMYADIYNDDVSVKLLFLPIDGFDNVELKLASFDGAAQVRITEVEMSLKEFMGLFKRFNIAISRYGIFEGREYTSID